MQDQWERFNARNRQLVHEDLGFEDNINIFTPTEDFQGGGVGVVTDYTAYSGNPVTAELSMPTSTPDQDEGGTTITADRIMHIRDTILDDLGTGGLTEYGESGEAPARVEPVDEPLTYEVSTYDDELNGVLRVELVEVDTIG